MTDWSQQAALWANEYQRAFNSIEGISYHRVATDTTVSSLSGTLLTFEQISSDVMGYQHPIGVKESVAAITLTVADLLDSETPFEPQLGDQITVPINGTSVVFDVVECPDGKSFSFFDKFRIQYQIRVSENG